jgi:hypothetical protein
MQRGAFQLKILGGLQAGFQGGRGERLQHQIGHQRIELASAQGLAERGAIIDRCAGTGVALEAAPVRV